MKRSKAESAELLATIRERIGNKDLKGLLGQVTRALELLPDRKDLQKLKGQLKEREERKDRKEADAYYNHGLAYYKNGDHDAAITDYTMAIRLNPEYANA